MTKQELEEQAKKKRQEYLDILEQIKELDNKNKKIQIRCTTIADDYNKYYTKNNIKFYNLDNPNFLASSNRPWNDKLTDEISQYNEISSCNIYLYDLSEYMLSNLGVLNKTATIRTDYYTAQNVSYRPSFDFI